MNNIGDDNFNMGDELIGEYKDNAEAVQVEVVPNSTEYRQREGDQPLPRASTEDICHHRLLRRAADELPKRLELGISRYGQPLQPFNGRDFARDAQEEFWDLGVYLEGMRAEREAMIEALKNVVTSYEDNIRGTKDQRISAHVDAAGEVLRLLTSIGVEV